VKLTASGAGPLGILGKLLRAATPIASLRQQQGRARLVASVRRTRRAWRARPVLVAITLAAVEAAALFMVMRVREGSAEGTPLAWHVENGAAGARGYVSVPVTASTARLVFGDGSDVALSPGSRGRVTGTTSAGARVVLEHGRARVHVQPPDHAQWLIVAGPFAVRVEETESLVAWSAEAETLDVWMRSGRVQVSGPMLGDALSLAPGQHVRARLGDGTVQIGEEDLPSSVDLGSEPCAAR